MIQMTKEDLKDLFAELLFFHDSTLLEEEVDDITADFMDHIEHQLEEVDEDEDEDF
jgi:hypothetical protein